MNADPDDTNRYALWLSVVSPFIAFLFYLIGEPIAGIAFVIAALVVAVSLVAAEIAELRRMWGGADR